MDHQARGWKGSGVGCVPCWRISSGFVTTLQPFLTCELLGFRSQCMWSHHCVQWLSLQEVRNFALEDHCWLYLPMVHGGTFSFHCSYCSFCYAGICDQDFCSLVPSLVLVHMERCSLLFSKSMGVVVEKMSCPKLIVGKAKLISVIHSCWQLWEHNKKYHGQRAKCL